MKILGKSDEGVLGEGEKIFFDLLYLPYWGTWDPQIFTHVGACRYPRVGYIKSTLALGGTEE